MIFKARLSDFEKADGTRRIVIYVYDSRDQSRSYYPTEFYVKKSDWIKGKVKNRLNADYINSSVNLQIAELEKNWLKDRGISSKLLKKGVESEMEGFIDSFVKGITEGRIMNNGQPFAATSIKTYVTYTGYLKEFLAGRSWKDVNEWFYNDYVLFLRKKGFKENTVVKGVKVLKSLMKRGAKHHSNTEYLNFKAVYQDVDTLALSSSEIDMIMNCKLPKHLEKERDRFYLSYNLMLRFGDSISIGKNDIFKKNGKSFIKVMPGKTKNPVIIPLFERSIAILKKYNYGMPKSTNAESNWKLKEIGKLAKIDDLFTVSTVEHGRIVKESFPKYHYITTHTARRSMATNLLLAGVDSKAIQLMGGWKSMSSFEKYLKIDKLQNALKVSEHPFFN